MMEALKFPFLMKVVLEPKTLGTYASLPIELANTLPKEH